MTTPLRHTDPMPNRRRYTDHGMDITSSENHLRREREMADQKKTAPPAKAPEAPATPATPATPKAPAKPAGPTIFGHSISTVARALGQQTEAKAAVIAAFVKSKGVKLNTDTVTRQALRARRCLRKDYTGEGEGGYFKLGKVIELTKENLTEFATFAATFQTASDKKAQVAKEAKEAKDKAKAEIKAKKDAEKAAKAEKAKVDAAAKAEAAKKTPPAPAPVKA